MEFSKTSTFKKEKKGLDVVTRLPVSHMHHQSSTASDVILNADNSPGYLQRSRWPSSSNPYSSAVATAKSNGGRRVDRKQFISATPVVDPLQAADIPIAHQAAMASRKIHTSHAGTTGGGRRQYNNFRIKSKQVVKGVNIFSSKHINTGGLGDGMDYLTAAQSTASRRLLSPTSGVQTSKNGQDHRRDLAMMSSANSTQASRVQQVAADMLQHKMPRMKTASQSWRRTNMRGKAQLQSGDTTQKGVTLNQIRCLLSKNCSGIDADEIDERPSQSSVMQKRHLSTGHMFRRSRANRSHGGRTPVQSGSQVKSFAHQSLHYATHRLAKEYEKGEPDGKRGQVVTPLQLVTDEINNQDLSAFGGWTNPKHKNNLPPESSGVAIKDIIPNLGANLGSNMAGDRHRTTNQRYTNESPQISQRSDKKNSSRINYSTFVQKGKPTPLATGEDDYSQSFGHTFSKDRTQAKFFVMNRINQKTPQQKPMYVKNQQQQQVTAQTVQQQQLSSIMSSKMSESRNPAATQKKKSFSHKEAIQILSSKQAVVEMSPERFQSDYKHLKEQYNSQKSRAKDTRASQESIASHRLRESNKKHHRIQMNLETRIDEMFSPNHLQEVDKLREQYLGKNANHQQPEVVGAARRQQSCQSKKSSTSKMQRPQSLPTGKNILTANNPGNADTPAVNPRASKAPPSRLKSKRCFELKKRKSRMSMPESCDGEKQVEFLEDTNTMINRLMVESAQLRQERFGKGLLKQLDDFCDKGVHEQHAQTMVGFESSNSGSASADSFNSAHVYDTPSSSSDGDGADNTEDRETEKIIHEQRKGERRRDKYMKDVEKRFVKQQGIKGFNKERMSQKAKNEGDRTKILTQMIFNDLNQKGDARSKKTLEQQSQVDEKRRKSRRILMAQSTLAEVIKLQEEDAKEDSKKLELNLAIEVNDFGQKGALTMTSEREGPQSNTDATANQEESKSLQAASSGVQSIASAKANDDFFNAYKKEAKKDPNNSDEEQYNEDENQFSDQSDQERNLAGIANKGKAGSPQDGLQQDLSSPRKAKGQDIQGIDMGQLESTKTGDLDGHQELLKAKKVHFAKHSSAVYTKLKQVVEKIKFAEVMQRVNKGEQSGLDQTAAYVFQQECNNSVDLMLPVIQKIEKGSLVLVDYTLQSGQVAGLAQAISKLNKPKLTNLFLDNCRIGNTNLEILLEACAKQTTLNNLTIKRDKIYEQPLVQLQNILSIKPPYYLAELRLVDCDTSPSVMKNFLKYLGTNKDLHIRSLALVQMKINFPLDDLADHVTNNDNLQELDISGNQMMPLHFCKLLKVLSTNERILQLNLSWNTLLDRDYHQKEMYIDYEQHSKSINERPEQNIGSTGHPFIQLESFEKVKPCDMAKIVYQSIGYLIRNNQNIQSINLDNTGLNQEVLIGLLPYIRHAKSLICLHLAQNPGITKEIKAFWSNRLSIKPKEPQLVIDVKRDRDDLEAPLTEYQLTNMTENERLIRDYKVANFRGWLMEEAAQIQALRQRTKVVSKNEVKMMSAYKQDMSIWRILGHSKIMPGSAQWQFNKKNDMKNCWFCGNWQLALVFWNQEIGIINANNNINIESDEKKRMIDSIRKHDADYMSNEDVPMFFSNSTNWKGRPFMKLTSFIERISESPQFAYQATEMAKENFDFQQLENLSEEKQEQVTAFIRLKQEQLKEEHFRRSLEMLPEYLTKKYLRFGKVRMINREKITDLEKTFVLPMFFKPGRTHFILRTAIDKKIKQRVEKGGRVRIMNYQTRNDVHFRFYYNRHIIANREERVPSFHKVLKVDDQNSGFQKSQSVFADWKPDTNEVIQNVLHNDFERWKVNRFVKDQRDQTAIKNFIKDNWTKIKEIRVGCIAESGSPPQMNERMFWSFCQMANIPDKNVTRGILNSILAATNFEEYSDTFNDDRDLIRYEFFEMMVRIAHAKYVKAGTITETQNSTPNARALHRLFNEHILTILHRKEIQPQWQPFRDNDLWTIPVNDLLETNLSSLRRLYREILDCHVGVKRQFCYEKVISSSQISIDQILFYIETHNIGRKPKNRQAQKDKHLFDKTILTTRMVRVAFYLSKMTVVDESMHGPLQFTHLQFCEFLEFLGRIAHIFFEKSSHHFEWHLSRKLFKILGWFFAPKNIRLVMSEERDGFVSDSDDDY